MGKWISQATPIRITGVFLLSLILVVPPLFIQYPASLDIVSFFLGGLALVVSYVGVVLYVFDRIVGRIQRYDEKLDEMIVEDEMQFSPQEEDF